MVFRAFHIPLLIFVLFAAKDSYALISGAVLEGKPDLVRLIFENGDICTGSYLDPYTILTAAHCLAARMGEKPPVLARAESTADEDLGVRPIETFLHPSYAHDFFPRFDVGILKTTRNAKFAGDYRIGTTSVGVVGMVGIHACGISDFTPKLRSRRFGTNRFLRIGSVFFFLGHVKNVPDTEGDWASVAPNDSGAPIIDSQTGELIAIATQATVSAADRGFLPAVSVGTSLSEPSTRAFLFAHLGP